MKVSKYSIFLVCCLVPRLFCHAQEVTADQMIQELPSAVAILNATALAYSNCNTYQDTGTVITRFEKSNPSFESKKTFSSAFIRPDRFRFEFWENDAGSESRYVVWMSGTDIKSWWTLEPKVERHSQIGNAIAGATGVSGGSAYTIPSLLIKEAAWKSKGWTNPDRAFRVSDGILENEPCYRIQRMMCQQPNEKYDFPGAKGVDTYWIRKADFMLVRFDSDSDFGTFLARSTTLYKPKMDAPVPEPSLEFGH